MNLTKFLAILLAVTLLAVLYVYQQSKIIHLAYQEQEKLAFFQRLVDINNNLKYNMSRRMSLASIAELWQEGNFEWPHPNQLVSFSIVQQTLDDTRRIKQTDSIFTRLFGLKSQAEATPVKPR